MSEPIALFDRALLQRRRARALKRAPMPDHLLARVRDDLLLRLELVRRTFPVALNLGAHDGLLSRGLAALPAIGLVVSADALPEMAALCPAARLVADEEQLPFGEGRLDLVVSALALQHVNDLPGCLLQVRRALKPDGLLLAALLGGETLAELRQAFAAAEAEIEGGASPRVAPFADVRALGGLLQRAGFALPVADSDIVTVTYRDPLDLMADLRAMGATNVLTARRRTPLKRATLLRCLDIYRTRFGRADGRVPATFEIVTLTGWVPHESQQKPLAPGSARTRLADALGVTERGAGEKAGE